MSSFNIQLPGIVIAGLYKKAIVQGEGKAVEGGVTFAPEPAPAPVEARTIATPPVQERQDSIPPPPPVTTTAATAPAEATQPAAPAVKPAAQPAATDTAAYKFLGKNQQHVTVIVQFEGEAFLPEQHLQLLTKMLGACKLNLGDVAIVNDASRKVEINQLKEQLYPKQVLLFGISPETTGLPLSFPMFKPQEYAGTTYLYTPPLEELNQETEEGKLLKRRLWDNLKKIFGV
ncbi:MAG: hypothetical protein J7621_20205 [Niastella sp.]|nr:hypothetical protein [Niastella sp.]